MNDDRIIIWDASQRLDEAEQWQVLEEWPTIDGKITRVVLEDDSPPGATLSAQPYAYKRTPTQIWVDKLEALGTPYDMATETKISWATSTFNPWMGCSKVSAGCANCYAESLMDACMGRVKWGTAKQGCDRTRTSESYWQEPFKWNSNAATRREPWRVFCASLADVFEDFETETTSLEEMRADLFDLIGKTPNLIWMLLTKRPENVLLMLPSNWRRYGITKIPANIWIGTSIENQETAEKRLPLLEAIPTRVRWVSAEPLVGRIQLDNEADSYKWIDWLIVGGESGAKARPMHPLWAQHLYGFAKEMRIPFHFKQWGEWAPVRGAVDFIDTANYIRMDLDGTVRPCTRAEAMDKSVATSTASMVRLGKAGAGASLFSNGIEIKEFPE